MTFLTLKRFFVLHFLLPFVLAGLVLAHVYRLHKRGGSRNPLGVVGEYIAFHPFYTSKDLFIIRLISGLMCYFVLIDTDFFMETLNYIPPDPMKTPKDIRPE